MRTLLDINVIIALLDSDHLFHDRAHGWWVLSAEQGWASCPLTFDENVALSPVHSASATNLCLV